MLSKEEHTKRLEAIQSAKTNTSWDYEDKEFDRKDWKAEVASGDTQLGYFDWVIHILESMPVYDYYWEEFLKLYPLDKKYGTSIQLRNNGNGKYTKWMTLTVECQAALQRFLQLME